jgi:hypothetical protein
VSRVDAPSFRCGAYIALFAWSVTEVLTGSDTRDWVFYGNVVLTAVFGVMAVRTGRAITKQREAGKPAHIDTHGPYALLKCSGCNQHLIWVEGDHDLDRLSAVRDAHECPAEADEAERESAR